MVEYNREHWERLMVTIIERIGAAEFLDHAAYALEQSGYPIFARRIQDLATLMMPESIDDD